MEKKRRVAMYLIAPAVIFIVTYAIYYMQAAAGTGDISKHMAKALSLDLVLTIPHCGWHLLCWLMYACLPITIAQAAAAATAAFNAFSAILVIWLLNRYLGKKNTTATLATFVGLIALLVGPCYLRFYNSYYYLGQGSPNVWHNPTATAVRPFMILVSVFTIDYWNCTEEERVSVGNRQIKKTTAYQLLLMLLLFISVVMKPSYLMAYLPVCAILALVKLIQSKGKLFGKLILSNLYFVPSLILFLWQYIKVYIFGGNSSSTGGIEIALFKVAKLYAPSVTVSLILKMAFPFLVIILWRKVIFKDKLFQLAFGQFLVGLAITWTLAETGSRAKSGNFGWSNILAASFLWIICLIFYVKQAVQDKDVITEPGKPVIKVKYAVPAVVLLWHLVAGIVSCSVYFREFP